MNIKMMSVAVSMLVGLSMLPADADAQVWEARGILQRTQSRFVTLQLTKGAETTAVAVVDREVVARLVSVTERIVPAIGVEPPRIFINHEAQPNAFVQLDDMKMPVMVMNTAMLKLVGEDEHAMAAVIGHELGHLKQRHLTDGASRQGLISLLGQLAGLAVDVHQAKRGVDTQGLGRQVGALGAGLVNSKFSRDQEREADDVGIRAMARAGFDPSAAPRLWRLMASQGTGGSGLWLDSHPSHAERERQLAQVASSMSYTPSAPTAPTATRFAGSSLPEVDDPWPVSPHTSMALTRQELESAVPSDYRQGEELNRSGRYAEAVVPWRRAAEQGDERALARLGDAYLLARGVEKDERKAHEFFERSASLGFAPAIFMLGDLAHRGVGRSRDSDEAVRMFSIAKQRNLPRASARLALIHLTGGPVVKNELLARSLAEEAAARGDALGKAAFGAMLRDGIGGAADQPRALQLLREAAEATPPIGYAQYQLALAYERGAGIDANRNLAIEQYRKALANGVPVARDRLRALGAGE